MYTKWFGEPDDDVLNFYRWNAHAGMIEDPGRP